MSPNGHAALDEGRGMARRIVQRTGVLSHQPAMLTRRVMSCRAADGYPIKVGMVGRVPTGPSPDTSEPRSRTGV